MVERQRGAEARAVAEPVAALVPCEPGIRRRGGQETMGMRAETTVGFPSARQQYLREARQLQALSLAVHIPLVCFGIAFPALVLFAEWRHLRTGDGPTARWPGAGRRRCSRCSPSGGHRDGTQLRVRTVVAGVRGRFGNVFGLGVALEGVSFFVEAIFIGIYVYGWDRISRPISDRQP